MSDLLKSVIQDLINDKPEQAQATIHTYLLAKTKEIVSIGEEKWSGDVKSKWSDEPEDLFKGSAEKIADALKRGSKDLRQAMSRLNFYINRAGKNLSAADKSRLEAAKGKLEAKYN